MEYTCKICGKTEESEEWVNGEEMYEKQLCFTCYYWTQQLNLDLTERKNHGYVIASGIHYTIGSEDASKNFRGFDGARIKINFFDGTTIISTNLWYQGEMPAEFTRPDNATIEWL